MFATAIQYKRYMGKEVADMLTYVRDKYDILDPVEIEFVNRYNYADCMTRYASNTGKVKYVLTFNVFFATRYLSVGYAEYEHLKAHPIVGSFYTDPARWDIYATALACHEISHIVREHLRDTPDTSASLDISTYWSHDPKYVEIYSDLREKFLNARFEINLKPDAAAYLIEAPFSDHYDFDRDWNEFKDLLVESDGKVYDLFATDDQGVGGIRFIGISLAENTYSLLDFNIIQVINGSERARQLLAVDDELQDFVAQSVVELGEQSKFKLEDSSYDIISDRIADIQHILDGENLATG